MTEDMNFSMSLYDLNKQVMSQLPPKAPEILKKGLLSIGN